MKHLPTTLLAVPRALVKFIDYWWSGHVSFWPIRTVFVLFAFLVVAGVVVPVALISDPIFSSNAAADCSKRFGGPYPPRADRLEDKIGDFKHYKALKLFLSKTIKLEDANKFEDSIKNNLSFPYGGRRQEYNYVIDKHCDILVAGWNDNGRLEGVLTTDNCPGKRDFLPRDREGMINWYPEEWQKVKGVFEDQKSQSPCWLGDKDDNRRNGLLDALSKHFMLAQGEGRTIRQFKDNWRDTEVAYAGEIIVDLDTCTYWLNNDSGTYGPKGTKLRPRGARLQEVAGHFAGELDIWPAFYYDADDLVNGAKHLPIVPTQKMPEDTATFTVSPWCP